MRKQHQNSLDNLKKSPRSGTRYSYAMLAKMTYRMMTMKFTVVQLAKFAKVSYGSANRWTAELHAAKCVHIIEYLRSPNNRTTSRVYQWGAGDDVPKPTAIPRKEYYRQWRGKKCTLEGAWQTITKRRSYVSTPESEDV
jgi:hypothetical protein